MCEKKVNVLTKAQTSDRISQVLSDTCGLYVVDRILKTSEVICAGKLKTNGSICLVHARIVAGKGVVITARTNSKVFTNKLCTFLYSKLKNVA